MWKGKNAYFLILPAMLIIIAVSIYPLIYTLRISFYEWSFFRSKVAGPFVGLANYYRTLLDPRFQNSVRLTAIFAFFSVLVEVCLGLGIALLLSKNRSYHRFVRKILIIPFIICPALIAYSWRFYFNVEFGIMDYLIKLTGLVNPRTVVLGDKRWAMAAVLMTDTWQWTPFMVLILSAGLSSVPEELYDAAVVDGASKLQAFRFITYPLLIPTLGVALIIKTVYSVKMFDKVFMMTQGGPGEATEVLSYHIYLEGFRFFHIGYAAAQAYLLVIVLVVLVSLYVQIINRGVA